MIPMTELNAFSALIMCSISNFNSKKYNIKKKVDFQILLFLIKKVYILCTDPLEIIQFLYVTIFHTMHYKLFKLMKRTPH